MSESLLIHITELPLNLDEVTSDQIPCQVFRPQDDHWHACPLSDVGDYLQHELADAEHDSLQQDSISVFIPNLHVLSTQVSVPRKQHKHLSQVLPFLCEEKLACDIDSVHIAAGQVRGEQVPVRIIQRSLLEQLLQRLQAEDITPAALFSDGDPAYALVPEEGQLLWIDKHRCLAIANDQSQPVFYGTTADQAPVVVQSLAASGDLSVYRQPLNSDTLDSEITLALEDLSSQGVNVEVHPLPLSDSDNPLLQLPPSGINLLSGPYAPKFARSSTFRWQAVALVASLVLGLNLLYLWASGYYFDVRAEQLHSDSETLYREYFPQDRRIINLRTQTQNHLDRGSNRSQNGFIALLGEFYPGWQAHGQHLTLKSIRFNQSRQEMLLEIESRNIEQLDQLRRSLGEQAELLSANESRTKGSQTGVKGRIKLSSSGASSSGASSLRTEGS